MALVNREDGLIDRRRLTEWLDVRIPELGDGPLEAKLIHGDLSNVIFSLDRGGLPMVG